MFIFQSAANKFVVVVVVVYHQW